MPWNMPPEQSASVLGIDATIMIARNMLNLSLKGCWTIYGQRLEQIKISEHSVHVKVYQETYNGIIQFVSNTI
jgi:hypothetical protein